MSESDEAVGEEPTKKASTEHSRMSVLYVSQRDGGSPVPSRLETEHGIRGRTVSSIRSAADHLQHDGDAIDCVVFEGTGDEPVELRAIERELIEGRNIPIVIYAAPGRDADLCEAYIRVGVDDVVTRTADTNRVPILAHRIERCVTREREDAVPDGLPKAAGAKRYGVLVVGSDGRIECADGTVESIGYREEALEDSAELRAVIADERVYRNLWETVTAGDSWNGELSVNGPDGEKHSIHLTATPVQDETGEVRRVVVVTSEGVDRSRYQQRLETVQQKYEALIHAAPDAIFVADADSGKIVEANEAASNLLNRPREEIIGMDHTELHPEEHRGRYRKLFEHHSNVGEGVFDRFESGEPLYVVTAEGQRIPVEVSATAVELDGRKLVQGHFRNTSERKRRERDLRSFREAVEQAGHAIMITDTDGTIEYVNPRFEEVTGYSEVEARGERPSILNSGEHGNEFYRRLWETIRAGEVWEGEIVNQRKDGERYYIDQTIAPITDDEESVERFVAINTDITERKRYESQLERERDRLEEFAGTVAHDLRNPLMIARGHVEIAREQRPKADIANCLDTAVTALERMETVIDEVLTLSERGATIREPEPVELPEIVETAWGLVEAPSATLLVDRELAELPLRADESRLCQAFENIFQNAVEYAGADVTVTVSRLPDREGFYVEDDGPGLPPKDRNRVFESGFTTSDDGTGFGLAIVKQIVEAHGWRITATDAAGDSGGARFEITGVNNG